MLSKSASGRLRRGIASLEFVLVFPMLLAIVSILFVIAQAGSAKVHTATSARNQTWASRPSAPGGSPLNWPHTPMDSKIDVPASQTVSLGPVFSNQTRQAQSENTLVANPWAFQTVPFPANGPSAVPHTNVLSMLPALLLGTEIGDLCQAMAQAYPGGSTIANFLQGLGEVGNVAVIAAGGVLIGSIAASIPGAYLEAAALGFQY